ncbi:MAG TPA: CrcB family protein [Bacteroidetes bacterium]|nr:CrcB family protein [Bacteroidota bacterium]
MNYLLVFLGGGLGSVCRFGIARWLASYEIHFPWATIVANIMACLVLGLLAGLSFRGRVSSPLGFFLMVGFCGGFSTFSTFTNETFQLMVTGEWGRAFVNVGLSLAACLMALYAGVKVGQWWG